MTVRRRILSLTAGVTLVALASSGCATLTGDTGADELREFVTALSAGDVDGAAALTTDPGAAAETLQATLDEGAWSGLDARTSGSDRRPDRDPVTLELDWIPSAPEGASDRSARTTGEARTVRHDDEWLVEWSPHVLDTRMAEGGRIVYSQVTSEESGIVDRTGAPLVEWSPVTAVTLDPEHADRADEVAALVGTAAPGITGQSIRNRMAELPGQPLQVVPLRPADLDPIRDRLAAIEGVSLPEHGDYLVSDRTLRSPALDGLRQLLAEDLDATSGWTMTLENPGAEPIELGSGPVGEAETITSTLQISIQRAAQDAVAASGLGASIVAIQPSTGGVLAVAQNEVADQQGPVSIDGRFPPGSTFKSVTTAAALGAGVVGADDVVPCPAEVTVSGRTIPNDDDFALGDVPLAEAFARSCNTTQAILSDRLDPDALTATASALGLGTHLTMPGLTPYTGSVPASDQGAARVEASIGQGEVLASPFGMALLEASLANGGRMVLPSLLAGRPAVADRSPEPLDESVIATIRRFQEQTVRSGTATAASGIEGLGGKTGTAEVADGSAHGWFVGSVGDLAFAVLVERADASAPAVEMAAGFLRAAGQPAPLAGG